MAGIASIPPKHLTARAYEWLTTAKTIYGVQYTVEVGVAACIPCLPDESVGLFVPHEYRAYREWCCGVEDMRAIYLNRPRVFKFVKSNRSDRSGYRECEIARPTCTNCLVIMDIALEKCPRKAGKYMVRHKAGSFIWKDQQ